MNAVGGRRSRHLSFQTYYTYTAWELGTAIGVILHSRTDNNWKDKLTAYDGQTITYDAIGNPLNDGRRRYEWQAGRQLKKVYIKADLKEGTKAGVDEQTGTVLKIEWSNGNLLEGEVTFTQASATVTRCGVDVTEEYAASAFNWVRDSGDAEADATWNATHAGMKSITCTATDLNGNVKISCTLTASSASYGSITVDDDLDASHTPGELDANDIFVIEDGYLKVTTNRGNVYALEDGNVKAAGAKLNGSIMAETKLFASQPENIVEFSYNHKGLRTQKKVTKADGTVETTDYTLHGKRIEHLTRGSDKMHFFYDAQNRPVMVECNGNLYSYAHNLQGDIMGILDSNGSLVVEYGYDAWGKPVIVRALTTAYETLAELNPFRYRDYVYDEVTELYYLRSRYYSMPEMRFINCDSLANYNTFVYCLNAPLLLKDSSGTSPSPTPPPVPQITPAPSRPENWDEAYRQQMAREKAAEAIKNLVQKACEVVQAIGYKIWEAYAKATAIDITEKLQTAMEENYNYLADYYNTKKAESGAIIAYIATNLEFASKVRSGGDWDYKSTWNLDKNQLYLYDGRLITYQDPGNMNFGYAGSAIHTLTDLQLFAGEYQIISGTSSFSFWKSYFDDPEDSAAIAYGYMLKQGGA